MNIFFSMFTNSDPKTHVSEFKKVNWSNSVAKFEIDLKSKDDHSEEQLGSG